jgi:hypothetical protein
MLYACFGSIYVYPYNLHQTNIIKNPTHRQESYQRQGNATNCLLIEAGEQ